MKQVFKHLSLSFLFCLYSCVNPSSQDIKQSNSLKQIIKDSVNKNEEIKYIGSFNGQVFNRKGEVLEGVSVSAKSLENEIKWESEIKLTNSNGEYSFNNVPTGARILITISKDGVSKTKTEVVETGKTLKDNPSINTFNFNSFYSLDSTLIKVLLFDEQKNQINEGLVKLESLDPNFVFVREYKILSENIAYSSSKEPLPINTKFKIIVKAKGKEKEQIITTEPSKIYNEIIFTI
ncbi:MAG: carboxypeptidase-like regulatory domain-containing protein [Candidatus Sericytochromatia bacterium]